MEFFKKNLNTNFIKICRIQISSKQRPQSLYPDHLYEIEYWLDNIYQLDNTNQGKHNKLNLYANTSNPLFLISSNNFYYKINNDPDNYFIDIGCEIDNYSTNIHVKIDTVNSGSVTFLCEPDNINDYTRLRFNISSNAVLFNNYSYSFINSSNSLDCRVFKNITKITEMNTNTVAWILSDGTIINGDNTKFTVTISSSSDYSDLINISAKSNCLIFIENFS